MRKYLETISNEIEQEILTNGYLEINGKRYHGNFIGRKSPLSGMCHFAISKLNLLIPDYDLIPFSFTYLLNQQGNRLINSGKHTVALVSDGNIESLVDPTIGQFFSDKEHVYSSLEDYPLQIIPGTSMKFSRKQFEL
jgi:hypothetical protein